MSNLLEYRTTNARNNLESETVFRAEILNEALD